MKIKILGNGGGINEGLPYNAFVVNDVLLCETPPDIMLSLYKNAIDLTSLKTIYISHLHGDHTFGLPFWILSVWFLHLRNSRESSYTIVGPKGLQKAAENLIVSAFTADHPCFEWMKQCCAFVEIDASSKPALVKEYHTTLFKLDHFIPTFGFSLTNRDGALEFTYLADTLWCTAIEHVLERQPQVVLTDLGGQDGDPAHLSMQALRENALPITGENTTYYGTHLKREFVSPIPYIKCAKPSMVIDI